MVVVIPSCAVTRVLIVFVPTESEIAPLAVPDVTEVPFTLTVAVPSVTDGVTVREVVALGTEAV